MKVETVQTELGKFWTLTQTAIEAEQRLKQEKALLSDVYKELVFICPHSESIQYKRNGLRMGYHRRCKICGITDYASEGGTPGDEYNYGYVGHPSESFWGDSDVETTEDEKEFRKYSRNHNWRVRNGKPE